jgi:hypothetical protein
MRWSQELLRKSKPRQSIAWNHLMRLKLNRESDLNQLKTRSLTQSITSLDLRCASIDKVVLCHHGWTAVESSISTRDEVAVRQKTNVQSQPKQPLQRRWPLLQIWEVGWARERALKWWPQVNHTISALQEIEWSKCRQVWVLLINTERMATTP